MQPITFTQITAENCELTKQYKQDEQGNVESTAIAHMSAGRARVISIADATDLRGVLAALESNQAITCGVPIVGDTPLTTRAGAEFRPDAVARTNEAFNWPFGPALFPIDVDVEGDAFPDVEHVLDALEACHPWLRHLTRVARPSSSSYVGGKGLRGVHAYFVVTRGQDVTALAKRMRVEQWMAGRGYVKISKSGALLARQLSDDLVYQPSRLMFEASPVCYAPIVRTIPVGQDFVVRAERPIGATLKGRTEQGWLDVALLAPLRDIEYRRFETNVRQAKDARRREAKRIAIDYQKENAIANGLDPLDGERFGLMATRALGDKALPLAWVLHCKDIGRQTVKQVIDALPVSLGFQCADPFDTWRPDLEAKHFGKAEIVMMGDTPGVWSHKLQTFFAFTEKAAASMAAPLECAAERLCGLIEYPEKMGRSASLVNIKHALEILLNEIDAKPRLNLATDYVDSGDCPPLGALVDALTRVGCSGVVKSNVEFALDALGEQNSFDPWKDAMQALPVWDKRPRLDTVFFDVCGTPENDAVRLTGCALFAGLVMRQLRPGAPLPIIPVLIGRQGVGKSRFVAGITECLNFPPPSALTFTDLRTMSMRAARSAVAELAEMSGMGKRDQDEVKSWAGDTVDAYRKPYARKEMEHPRRFVVIGTANQHELNRDVSGNRRFMPIDVLIRVSPQWTIELPQILAEAKQRFCAREEDYHKLLAEAVDAVYAFNMVDMNHGVGVPEHTLDDLLPAIIRALYPTAHKRRIMSGDVRTALDNRPSGRNIHAKEIAQWFVRKGWVRSVGSRGRYFEAPEGFELDPSEEADEGATPPVNNPFSKYALVH